MHLTSARGDRGNQMHGCPHTKEGKKIQLGVFRLMPIILALGRQRQEGQKFWSLNIMAGKGAEDLLRCCRGLENVRGGNEKRREKTYSDGKKRDLGL